MLPRILGVPNRKVVPALFAYLFYRIDQRAFLKYIVERGLVKNRETALAIKDAARVSGYVLKNCKLYAWACWSARVLGKKMPSPKLFEVDVEDAKVLKRLNLKHLESRSGFRYTTYTLKTFDRMTQEMLYAPELRNYIGKFVTKKMGFLMKSYGETRHDLETQLKESAILVWYKQYPRFDSDLHMINVAKAQIHNVGQTMITTLTSKSRQRLTRNADGTFDSLAVDISVVANEVVAPPQYGAALQDHIQVLAACEHKMSTRVKEFLLCAAGQPHEGLSEFLGCDNEDAATEWPYPKYMRRVRKYFDVTEEKVEQLFRGIRKFANQTNIVR